MPTKLGTYNGTLRILGLHRLTTLTDDVESRYVLDDAWPDAVLYVLENGDWKFGTATELIAYDPQETPVPGYGYAFLKPTDWLHTVRVFVLAGEPMDIPFADEADLWHADETSIYVTYVKTTAIDPETWTATFGKAVESFLAFENAERLTASASGRDRADKLWRERLWDAKAKDAMRARPRNHTEGSWVASRRGYQRSREQG